MVNCINLIIEMSPRFVLGRENVPCVAEVVNRSLKADCTDFIQDLYFGFGQTLSSTNFLVIMFTEIDQSQTGNMSQSSNSKSFTHGDLLLEVVVGLICQWIHALEKSGM